MAFTKPAHGNRPGGEYPRPIEKANYNRADDIRQRWLNETGENHLSTANLGHRGSSPHTNGKMRPLRQNETVKTWQAIAAEEVLHRGRGYRMH